MSLTSLRSARPDTTLRYILIPHAGVSFVLFHEAFTRQIWSNVIVSPAVCSKRSYNQPTTSCSLMPTRPASYFTLTAFRASSPLKSLRRSYSRHTHGRL